MAVTQSFNTSAQCVLLCNTKENLTGEHIRDKFAASKEKRNMDGRATHRYGICDRKLVINPEETKLIRHYL